MAIAELGRIGQWGTSTPSSTPSPTAAPTTSSVSPMPTSGEVVAETTASGRLNVTVTFCQAAGFNPPTPNMVQLVFDKPYTQGGAQLIKMPAYLVSSDAQKKCHRFGFQMAPEQVLQHKGRRMFVHLYANGALLSGSPVEQNFTMPMAAPTSIVRLPVTPTGSSGAAMTSTPAVGTTLVSWPNPNPTTAALQPQAPAPELKRDVQVVAPLVQAAAAAFAPTPPSVKTSAPTPAVPATTVKESGSLLPTALTKGAVQLPVKSGFGVPAYLAMGAVVLAGFWWSRKTV